MDIRSRDIIVIAVVIFGFFYFWSPGEKESVPNYEVVENEDFDEEEQVSDGESLAPLSEPLKIEKIETLKPPKKPQKNAKYPNLDESFVPFDAEGHRYIEQVVKMGKHLVYHGDVLLGDEKDLPRLMKNKLIKQGQANKWPGGKIPYVIDESVAQEDLVIDAIEYLNTFTNLKIVPRQDENDYVLVTRGESDCYSYAGRIGGKQEIFLVPQCNVKAILHEWMHTIGFFHEQNREDRDQYLEIVWDNIDEINKPQFKKLPNDFIGLTGRPFDMNSIMLYSSDIFSMYPGEPAMLTKEGEIIPRNQNLLSDEDINRVNLAYPASR